MANRFSNLIQQRIFGLVDAGNQELASSGASRKHLEQSVVRRSDILAARPRSKAKDLMGLLLGHGARSLRSSEPRVNVRLRVLTPNGEAAVKIRFQ